MSCHENNIILRFLKQFRSPMYCFIPFQNFSDYQFCEHTTRPQPPPPSPTAHPPPPPNKKAILNCVCCGTAHCQFTKGSLIEFYTFRTIHVCCLHHFFSPFHNKNLICNAWLNWMDKTTLPLKRLVLRYSCVLPSH